MRKLLLVLLVIGLLVGSVVAEADIYTSFKFKNLHGYNKDEDIKFTVYNDWILKKDIEYKSSVSTLNETGKKTNVNIKIILESLDKEDVLLLKYFKELNYKKEEVRELEYQILPKIINQLKPKEYKLKVIMVEDDVEKVIGERGDITIEGDHIEKIYKSYSDIEFKDGVEYFEKDHKSGIKYEEEPMNPKHFPNIKIDKIKSNNEIIHNGKMNIIYNKKNNKKYELFFKVKLDKYYSWTGTDGRSGGKDPKQDFQGDIIIGLSQKSILSDFDIKLKTIKNLKLNPGESKKIKVTLNLDNLKKNCYKIIPIIYKKNGVKSIKGKVAHYSTEANDKLFIVKENLLKKYKVKQGYVLKDKDEEGSTK